MQDNSLCKCKSFYRRTAEEWPKVLVVSLHQFLNGGRQDLLSAGVRAFHAPVKTAEHKTHTKTLSTAQSQKTMHKSYITSAEARHVLIMWT